MISDLLDNDLNAYDYIASGQLFISSIHMYQGANDFNPNSTITNWKKNVDESIKNGYRGLRVMGEGTFALDGKDSTLEKLIEYEMLVNKTLIPYHKNHQYLCIYNKKMYPKYILDLIIKAHPNIIHNNEVILNNSFYQKPRDLIKTYNANFMLNKKFNLTRHEINLNLEKELRSNIEMIRYLAKDIGDGVWELDLNNNDMNFNEKIYALLGYTKNEFATNLNSFIDFIHSEDKQYFLQKLNEHIEGKINTYRCEYRLKSKNKDWIWVLDIGKGVIKSENGNMRKIMGMYTNITNDKITEIKCKKNAELIEHIMNSIPCPIFCKNSKNEYVACNKAFCSFAKMKETDILGNTVKSILPDKIAKEQIKSDDRIRKTGSNQVYEIKISDINNKKKTIFVNKSVFKFSEDDEMCIVGLIQDITELKSYEDELKSAKITAEEANKAKSQFLASMSHEIRTTMNGIIGMLQLMELTNLTAKQKEYSKIIWNSTNRLMNIVNKILDLSKITSDKFELSYNKFNIHDTINEISHIYKTSAINKGLKYIYEIDEDISKKLMGSNDNLVEILSNLLDNAIKFTDDGYIKLIVTLNKNKKNSQLITFSVEDSGIGISNIDLNKIYSAFTQLNNSKNNKYPGTGLGLTIVKNLVEQMGGTIWVESTLGSGSIFNFSLTFEKEKL